MEHINQWPPVLLRRWLLQIMTGLGCLLVGVVVFLVMEDQVLLVISVLLAMFTAVRFMSLYQQIAGGKYETVEGICIRIKNAPLRKQWSISLLAEDGSEQTILLGKQTKVQIGNLYRVYFGSVSGSHICLAQDSFLALEDLGKFQAGAEKDF